MKKETILWGGSLLGIIAFLIFPTTHEIFVAASKASPYLMGFIKFAILATMGELLAARIVSGKWKKLNGLLWRVLIWGFVGVLITLMFVLFDAGVRACIQSGYLPSIAEEGFLSTLSAAFFTSALMNAFFGTSFMLLHRMTDTWIDRGEGKMTLMRKVSLGEVVEHADLKGFISFVVCKTIPIFWVPAHTITFMLPSEYRVLMAAMLSICLGVILGIAKKTKKTSAHK